MHTAEVKSIGVDAANQYLVTASEDKTARVWELATGRLIRTLRPPVGAGSEGKLYAAAISPDGRIIATGGWTGVEWDKTVSIYLFDRASGKMLRRLTGLPNVVLHLAFSPDNTLLAATLYEKGVRIFRVADGTEAGRDESYGDQSYGADFDGGQRLVTSCYDGFIRLYNREFRQIAKAAAPGGKRPYAVRFSPDGKKIAVGYIDSTSVSLLSGDDLSALDNPETKGIDNGSLSNVAWSKDGAALYAGGRYGRNGSTIIRRWSAANWKSYKDLPAAGNTILDLAPLIGGGLAFGSADPAWGVLSAAGERVSYHVGWKADYRGNLSGFQTDSTGNAFRFSYLQNGQSPAVFSLASRTLKFDSPNDPALQPPRTSAPGLSVSDWEDRTDPKLNGAKLALEQYETSHSLAVAPDGQKFLLGTNFYLRLFDKSGREQWKLTVPDTAWGVNISGNGKVALAAFGDGTIRSYNLSGEELLAFFPSGDKKRWVLWNPKGYYDASPGGEELIGWHLNNGSDAASDFFPFSKFRAARYRPELMARILEVQDPSAALKMANAESGRKREETEVRKVLPPVVEILSPADQAEVSAQEVTLQFVVRGPSAEPVTGLKALIDGRPASTERGVSVKSVPQGDAPQSLRVVIPARDCEISILAENRYASSVPATIRLKWRGKTETDEFVIKPKLYVLAVGISRYANKDLTLGFAAKDARDIAATMQKQNGGLYRDVVVRVLTDEKATKDDILDGFDWIRKETTSKDVAMVFLAGHGVNDQSGQYYFLPENANLDSLLRTGVSFSDIRNTVLSLAGKALFFVDTCHSGNVFGSRRGTVDIMGMVNELASADNGAVVFASSTGNQYSLEDPQWNNGAFTKALVEGLNGKADFRGTGKISINMLDLYLSERVKELTRGRQTPTTTKPQTVPDFPVAVIR
ncbi:MAG TPA: caspase family protein [Blastocatellia bacterium]|nr:caspase family protein [Blastocatellia bacterium]